MNPLTIFIIINIVANARPFCVVPSPPNGVLNPLAPVFSHQFPPTLRALEGKRIANNR